MSDNAKNIPCGFLINPTDEKYAEETRQFQGCPTIAVTPKGRVFLGWYSGGGGEPQMDNYNVVVYSDDDGESFSKPVVIIPSSKENLVHAIDIQLWMHDSGELYIFWTQNNVEKIDSMEEHVFFENGFPRVNYGGYNFLDRRHTMWCSICKNPDADVPEFTKPERLDYGFLRCKPFKISDGRYLFFNYDQTTDNYMMSITEDCKKFTRIKGAEKLLTHHDETMGYQMSDGRIRMLARANGIGRLAESYSYDGGLTWTRAEASDIVSAATRFFVSRTPSGRILLIHNDHPSERTNMTVCLSEDDGRTWEHKLLIDNRAELSYPDADFYDGKIYITYDRERHGAREIILAALTEDDIVNGKNDIELKVASKPSVPRTWVNPQ